MIPALLFALAFFVDPLVFYRSLCGNDIISSICVVAVLAATTCQLWPALQESAGALSLRLIFIGLVAYSTISLLTRLRIGMGATDLIQHAVFVVQIFLLCAALRSPSERISLVHGFLVATALHISTLLPIPGIAQSLSDNTSYASGDYAIGIITRRATGFFPAPGFLSLFATVALGIGLAILETGRRIPGTILVIAACTLGIATLSRSFFVVMPLVLMIHAFRQGLRSVIWAFSFVALFILIAPEVETLSRYLDLLDTRMARSIDLGKADRLNGDTGLEESLKVIQNWPVFGQPAIDDGALKAWNGDIFVRPHTGVITLLTYYGFLLAVPVLFLLASGASASVRALLFSHNRSNRLIPRASHLAPSFALAFAGANIICLVEPLIETSMYFLCLLGVLIRHQSSLCDYRVAK